MKMRLERNKKDKWFCWVARRGNAAWEKQKGETTVKTEERWGWLAWHMAHHIWGLCRGLAFWAPPGWGGADGGAEAKGFIKVHV